MIKSINYQANRIASIEISDPEDINTLGDSYGYGSTARVTGQISAEYMYTPNGWISTSSGGAPSGGGATVVDMNSDPTGTVTLGMKAGELLEAMKNGPVFVRAIDDAAEDAFTVVYALIEAGLQHDSEGYKFSASWNGSYLEFLAATADEYPSGSLSDADGRE